MMRMGLRRVMAPMRAAAAAASPVSVAPVALEGIETRWASLGAAERTAAKQQIAQLMKSDWKKLTPAQKQAST